LRVYPLLWQNGHPALSLRASALRGSLIWRTALLCGAYCVYTLPPNLHVPLVIAAIVAVLLVALFSIAMERVLVRSLAPFAVLMMTLAVGRVAEQILLLMLSLEPGEITGVLGPNGAGTTPCDLLTGFIQPDRGTVQFDGAPLIGVAPYRIVNRGLARTFHFRFNPRHPGIGTAVLPVGQDARSALGIADRVYVMEHGQVVRAGTSAEIAADDSVRQAYLGV
jgi:hypothetical protein